MAEQRVSLPNQEMPLTFPKLILDRAAYIFEILKVFGDLASSRDGLGVFLGFRNSFFAELSGITFGSLEAG